MKRSEKKVKRVLDISADQAWDIIGAVSGVDKWFSEVITSCRVEGNKRYCSTADGAFEEDILTVDHEKKVFEYGIPQQHLLPVSNIVGRMTVPGRLRRLPIRATLMGLPIDGGIRLMSGGAAVTRRFCSDRGVGRRLRSSPR